MDDIPDHRRSRRADRGEEAVAGRTDTALPRSGRRSSIDTLHSFLLLTEDRAMADAKAAEARMMAGGAERAAGRHPDRAQGHLQHRRHPHDRRTPGCWSTTCRPRMPPWSRKWAEAGTVMMGKLATHEFAMGGPSFDLPWPPARNPWNPDHFTAGSSSGTGAAVAAGLVLGGTGSDTGGSIRGPVGAVRHRRHQADLWPCPAAPACCRCRQTLDHAGPMAWTVEDCALLLQAMAGHDPLDPASADRPVADFTADLGKGVKGLRIGVIRHFHRDRQSRQPGHATGHRRRAGYLPRTRAPRSATSRCRR